jgi:hypothetical protein
VVAPLRFAVFFRTSAVGGERPPWRHPRRLPYDAQLLDVLAEWVPDEAARRRILVDNPAELYDFPRGA